MGITFSNPKVRAKASLKLASAISSYLFEQECGDLRYATPADKEAFRKALEALNGICTRSKG